MAVSGTTSTTIFNTNKVIDRAFGRCKKSPQEITPEMQSIAQDNLYLLLSSLANKGIPLWCITTELLGFTQGNPLVSTPRGTIQVLNANLRTMTRVTGTYTSTSGTVANAFDGDVNTICTELAAAGNIILDVGSGQSAAVSTIGVLPGASGTWDLTFAWSDDGVTYTDYHTETSLAVTDNTWVWVDVYIALPHRFWRVTAGATTTLVVRELYYGNNPNGITMGPLNKDDYFSYPNKVFQGQPLQYWQDRQVNGPVLNVWPAPDSASQFRLIETKVHRHIMDVGTLQQTLEIPQRWFNAIVWMLAKSLAADIREIDYDRVIGAIKDGLAEEVPAAWSADVDNSPIVLRPDISVYTTG